MSPPALDNGPPVRHMDRSPVMIIGHGSSGTSITGGLIRKYLKISFGTESQFIPRYYDRLPAYGDLKDDGNLRRLVSDLVEERWFTRSRKFGFETTAESILSDVAERSFRGVLEAVFGQLARCQGMERWGDKTPEYVNHLDVLEAVFPDALYVHLVRDGRDVALSAFERFWGRQNLVAAALDWREAVEKVCHFAKTIDRRRILELRYEDLLTDPRGTFARLIAFLGIEDPDGALADFIGHSAAAELKSSNFNKWKSAFSDRQKQAYDRINGDLLAQYGYETRVTRVRRVPRAEAVFWEAHSRVRQWRWPEYWKDNVYKASLRAKGLLRTLGRAGGLFRGASPLRRGAASPPPVRR